MPAPADWESLVSEPAEEPHTESSDDILSLTVRLTLLEDVARLVATGSDLERLLHRILALCESVVEAEAASVLLIDERSGELVFAAATGEKADHVRRVRLRPGEGIAGWVVEHGEPLIIPSAEGDDRWSSRVDELTGFRTRSLVCVPMQLPDRTVGAVELINRIGSERFTEADVDLLSAVAAPAALLIENARLLRRLERGGKRLGALVEALRGLAADRGAVPSAAVLARAAEGVAAEGAALALATPEGGWPFAVVSGTAAEAATGQVVVPGVGVCGWVAQSQEAASTEDPAGDPRFQPAPPWETGEAVRSLLAVPLPGEERARGVLAFFNLAEGVDEETVALARAFADSLSLALGTQA